MGAGAWDVTVIGKDPASQAALVSSARSKRLPLSVVTDRVNTGDEAVPYLRFIIAHYDAMPAVTAFLHGCPFNHQPYIIDFLACVREDWTGAGYFPLNKNYFSSWGAKNSFLPFEPLRLELNEKMRVAGVTFEFPPVSRNTFHCSQFLVSAAAVRARPRRFYEVLLDVALTRVPGADGVTPDRKFTAVFFEFTWHTLFGRPLEEPFLEPGDYCGSGGPQPFSSACCDAHPLIREQLSDEQKHDWRDMYENETARYRGARYWDYDGC